MLTDAESASSKRGDPTLRLRQYALGISLCLAALANVLVPAIFFSEARLFGHTNPRDRVLVAVFVVVVYLIAFLFVTLHANIRFASGYAVATAATVTLGSAGLAYLVV